MNEEVKPKKQKDPTISALSKINNILQPLTQDQRKAVLAFLHASQPSPSA